MNSTQISPQKYLNFLTLTYTVLILLSNWFDPRIIHIFGLDTDAGTLIFPITFLLSDLITEVYGYKYARQAIWIGFLFNVIFITYGQIVIRMPSPNYHTNNIDFDKLFYMDIRVVLGSCLTYFISEPINSFIMSKTKIKMKGRYLAFRFVLSTLIASGVDSVFFTFIAFYKIISDDNLISLLLTMWMFKVIIEIMGLPISIYLVLKLKKSEQMDIYDRRTNFNLFNFDTNYLKIDNEFKS